MTARWSPAGISCGEAEHSSAAEPPPSTISAPDWGRAGCGTSSSISRAPGLAVEPAGQDPLPGRQQHDGEPRRRPSGRPNTSAR